MTVLADLFSSKKFLASFSGAILVLVLKVSGKAGIVLDPATAGEIANLVAVLVAAYVVGQGQADHGKEAAQITADAAADSKADDLARITKAAENKTS